MWIAASVPLWVLGSITLLMGVAGFVGWIQEPVGSPREHQALGGAFFFLAAAALFLFLAAKVAA